MIYTYQHLTKNKTYQTDVCIIGSGAGGSAAAATLSSAGLKVILIEAGDYLMPKDFNQREESMYPKLFYEAGGRRTNNRALRVIHGHGVGGSTLHNINLCKKLPKEILDSWNLKNFTQKSFGTDLEQVEKDLQVQKVAPDQMNEANLIFQKGVNKLGYRGGPLSHNRVGCKESGFCELGCSFNAKMNAVRVYIPSAVKNQTKVFSNTKGINFTFKNKSVQSLEAKVIHPENKKIVSKIKIKARFFVASGGAIETPLLLQRSNTPDPHSLIGKKLHLHPGVVALGVFPNQINCWRGIPQSFECTEFLSFNKNHHDKRVWLITSSAHPIGAASIVPGFGNTHRDLMAKYPYIVPVTPMIHDLTTGSVSTKLGGGASIDYTLNNADRAQLGIGLKESARILFAAGAKEVLIPTRRPLILKNMSDLKRHDFVVNDHENDMVAVHPMSTVWMGDSPKSSCLDSTGKYHHVKNLYVADASVYPTSLGVPPQISTYAIGHFVAKRILDSLPRKV